MKKIITIVIIIIALVIIYKTMYKCTENVKNIDNVWITYIVTGGIAGYNKKLIINKNNKYYVYDHNKLIKHGRLKQNINKEVNDILKLNIEKEDNTGVMDAMYYSLTINGKDVNVNYSYKPMPKLINILDELIF